ncbi:Mitochondrial basic amino acids transporter-like [Oopsacas minuta]|uniref:Mitochondrial basic amino acids transporter-like n=1 Tax=Oopsacas minuta TaxID=111878 RepID=A0AAV7KJ17_9METZ|nr:Mitochondrial basic amino acids transporter-like [Oopsacas minuta]
MQENYTISPSLHYFVAGWLGGCTGLLVGHPWDTVRVRLQTQGGNVPIRYKGTLHCIKNIIKTESVLGLYKGLAFPLLGYAGLNAAIFGTEGNVMKLLQPNEHLPRLNNSLIAGACGGIAGALVASPVELVKIQMQMQNIGILSQNVTQTNISKIGPFTFTLMLIRNQGITALLTKGLWATILRDAPCCAIYFFLLDGLCYLLLNEEQRKDRTKNSNLELHPFKLFMIGGIAGTIGWSSTYPCDVIKSRLQADVVSQRPLYKGVTDCFYKTISQEGIRPLFAGLKITLLTAFPINAVTLLTVILYLRLAGTSLVI